MYGRAAQPAALVEGLVRPVYVRSAFALSPILTSRRIASARVGISELFCCAIN
jgi:hypothetical protein